MNDTTLPFPYQSDQQLADWQESQSSEKHRYDDDGYCQSFLSTCDAEGNAPDWAIDRIMREHGSSLILMSEHVSADKLLNGREILNWLGY